VEVTPNFHRFHSNTTDCIWMPFSPWLSGVMVSALASINEVNLRRDSGPVSTEMGDGVRVQFPVPDILVCNQPATQGQLSLPSFGVGKWVPASAGKAKAGMAHSVSGWTRGVQVKLWDPLRTRVIPERLGGVFTTRRYTNPRLPLPWWLLFNRHQCCRFQQNSRSYEVHSTLHDTALSRAGFWMGDLN